jgi:hypothetical protein
MPVRETEELQRLAFERVVRTNDGHTLWEVPKVGSVWRFPLIPFHTPN